MALGYAEICARYLGSISKDPLAEAPWTGGPRLVFDIETDGLDATVIHCICIRDLDTDEAFEYGPGAAVQAACAHLSRAGMLIGHNSIAYDLPCLKHVCGWEPPAGCVIRDTLVLARLILQPIGDIDDAITRVARVRLLREGVALKRGDGSLGKLRARQSLAAWGERLGIAKTGVDIEDWTQWTQEMQERCAVDVQITAALYQFLRADAYSQAAVRLEHRVAEVCEAIRVGGAPFDLDAAHRLAAHLTAQREPLRKTLAEKLPGVNLRSCRQIAEVLTARGWKPRRFTKKSKSPKLDDKVLDELGATWPEFADLAAYLKLDRLIAKLRDGEKALCKYVVNGRVHGRIQHMGTPHSRASHYDPTLANLPNPKKGTAWGAECRSLVRAPPGRVIVSCDQQGLQDRAFAHYLAAHDAGAYAATFDMEDARDTHWRTTIALELMPEGTALDKDNEVHRTARENAKTFRYGFLFGAGQKTAGEIIRDDAAAIRKVDLDAGSALHRKFFGDAAHPGEAALKRVGKRAIERFLAATPGLRELREKLATFQQRHRWLPGLDLRRVSCGAEYLGLNYCATSAEAIICKAWLVAVYDELRARFRYGPDGDAEIILWTHDEITVSCTPEIADAVGEILVRCATTPRETYRFKCSLAADYTIAPCWNGTIVEVSARAPPVEPDPDIDAGDALYDVARARKWREDIAAINAAMVEQGIAAPPLSEAVAAFMDPPPAADDEDAPEPDLTPPPQGGGHAGNRATPPPGARAGGSISPDPPPDGARRKLYGRITADLRGRDYRCVASFDYLMPSGGVAFTEDRFELHPARAAAHPDRARKLYRFWHRGADGVVYADTGPRRIIYGWPAIMIAGPGAQVFVVEGAYKAQPLTAAGLLATAAPYHRWEPEMIEALAGRHIVYLEDYDTPDAAGKRSSERLSRDAKDKLAPRAASFKIVPAQMLWDSLGRSGEPPHGWDVKDWIEAGPTTRLGSICAKVADAKAVPSFALVGMDEIEAEEIDFMWNQWISRGGLALITGLPGIGKSQVAIWIVACATTGRPWPDGAPGCEPCDVIMLTAEDTLASTMKPRLLAAGADTSRVRFITGIRRNDRNEMFVIGEALEELDAYLAAHPKVGLLTFDPLTAFIGSGRGFDSHRVNDVRAHLSPLKDLAEKHHVAVVCITHPPKAGGPNAQDQVIGTQAFTAAARHIALCAAETQAEGDEPPRPTGRSFLIDIKHSISKPQPTLIYTISEKATGHKDRRTGRMISAPYVVWEGTSDVTFADLAAGSASNRSGTLAAQNFLRELLAAGPVPLSNVVSGGAAAGHSIERLDRLRRKLGIVKFTAEDESEMWALSVHAPLDDASADDF